MFDVAHSAYDNFMGRYSFRLAPVFASFSGIAPGARVLDVGAGTGALALELERRGANVSAVEPSDVFVRALRERLPHIDLRAAPAEAMPFGEGAFDAALAQLVVTFMKDPDAGIREMRRVVRPGGVVAACMWDRKGMELLAAVQRTQQQFGAAEDTVEARTKFRTQEELEALFSGAGFADARSELLEVETEYGSFDELWSSLLGGAGPAGAWTKALDESKRAKVREELYRQVGAPDAAFRLKARAWAVRAKRV